MKLNIRSIFLIIIILVILILSFFYLEKTDEDKVIISKDHHSSVKIGENTLKVTYLKGNEVNEIISFGNVKSKEIKVKNIGKNNVSFQISLENGNVNNDLLTYDVYIKDESSSYQNIISNSSLNSSYRLIYNIGIKVNQEIDIRIDFKANKENEDTVIKGSLNVLNNLSEKDLFIEKLYEINDELNKKIKELNDISIPGNYIINIKKLISKNDKYYGYIFIDATDIGSINYYYSVYNDKYMINNFKWVGKVSKNKVNNVDDSIKSINEDKVCKEHTKKECKDFFTIPYNEKGNRITFIDNINELLKKVKIKSNDKNNYIYNVKEINENVSELHGYILVNDKDIYLYLNNGLYMVSGYNITKLGNLKENSTAIRAYRESSFNLSSKDESTVCKFTGFTECLNSKGEKV